MGACQCKCCLPQDEDRSNLSAYDAPSSSRSNSILGVSNSPLSRDRSNSSTKKKSYAPKSVDNLILQTLNIIGKLGLSGYLSVAFLLPYNRSKFLTDLFSSFDQEPPDALQKLHVIGDQEEGWLQIIISMINVVPVDDPLGPAVITVVLDDCPLPNKVNYFSILAKFNHQCIDLYCPRSGYCLRLYLRCTSVYKLRDYIIIMIHYSTLKFSMLELKKTWLFL